MGSKSSSSSSSQNKQRQTTLDASQNEGVAAASGGDLDISILDGGAVAGAFDFATEVGGGALEFGTGVFNAALDAVSDDREQQFQNQADLVASVATAGRSETSQALDKITTYFFITVAVMGGLYLIRGQK